MAVNQSDFMVTGCKVEWKIRQFLSITPRETILSKLFQFANNSWRIYITPESMQKANSINIGLKRESFEFDIHLLATTIGIKKADGSVLYSINELLEFGSSTNSVFFGAGFMDRTPLVNSKDIFLPGGNLTIMCNISLKKAPSFDTENILAEKGDSILANDLEDLFLSERQTDVIIKIKDKQFKSHLSILAARSEVFAAMFEQDMTERRSGVVEITDCDPDSFKEFLLYIYTGRMDQVTSDNAAALYTAADKYGLNELKVECAKCMNLNLSIDSVCNILPIALMHDEPELLQNATKFFVKNMKTIVQTDQWIHFQRMHCNLMRELFLKTAEFVDL